MANAHPIFRKLCFDVRSSWEEVEAKMKEGGLDGCLDEAAGLGDILLVTDYWKYRCELVDFTEFTVREAIEQILMFYENKKYRRLIGDHVFFEGFNLNSNNNDFYVATLTS